MFKANQWIKCIDDCGAEDLSAGAHYRVVEAGDDWVSILNDNFQEVSYVSKRFVLVTNHEGIKYDAGKPRVSLIPTISLIRCAHVFTYGANKYGDHNYRKGFAWSRVLDAIMRHSAEIAAGRYMDPESGLPHYAHIMASAAMLGFFQELGIGEDDIAVEPMPKEASFGAKEKPIDSSGSVPEVKVGETLHQVWPKTRR